MSENKVDIKELMRKNNLPVPEREYETNNEEIVGKLPEGFDKSQIENACDGVVVENEDIQQPLKGGGITGMTGKLSPEQMESIQETLAEMDEEASSARKEFEEWNKKQAEENEDKAGEAVTTKANDDGILEIESEKEDDLVDKESDRESFNKKYGEAVVIIDKSKMGQVVDFTEAERAKLERVKKIKLEEVETKELKTIKSKRVKKGAAEKILQKVNSIRTTNIVLPISGYTAVMKGCSTFELMGLVAGDDSTVMGLVSKWTLIHSKIESTSIGHMDFNKFLNNVSQLEYDIFVYGILCATFPDEDTFPLVCPKCQTNIEHKYLVRTLLRAEAMSERLQNEVKRVIDASYTEEAAKECFESSLLNTVQTIQLPESDYIVSIGVQSAHSFIYDSIDAIDKMDEKYAQAAILSSAVSAIFIEDPDSPEEYFEIDDTTDMINIIFSLGSLDIGILGAKIGKNMEGMQFAFGLMDINCPKPKCGNHINTVPVDMDSILFHKYQQAMSTTID